MGSDTNRSIQILNISNVNAQGKTVLNDGKLLELIQKYPLLYNSHIRTYNDNDYMDWAWKNINAAFNRSYASDPSAAFSTNDLITRWQILKPLIQCLSKAYDLNAIPQALRKSVVKISAVLDNQNKSVVRKPYNSYQYILQANMNAIDELPTSKKLVLEKDILSFILNAELENKPKKLNAEDLRVVNQETENFLNEIGFNQVLLTSSNYAEKILLKTTYSNKSSQRSVNNCKKYKRSLGWIPLKQVHSYTKSCKVKIKRISIEDYLPLSKIVPLKMIKTDPENLLRPDSPGIFGN